MVSLKAMKQLLLICAVVALVGCGESKEDKVLGTWFPRLGQSKRADGAPRFTLHKGGGVSFHGDSPSINHTPRWFMVDNEIKINTEDDDHLILELREKGDLMLVGVDKGDGVRRIENILYKKIK